MKLKLIIPLVVLGLLVAAYFLLSGKKETADAITVAAQKGAFEVLVYTSGQLEAENSEKIIVPEELGGRNVRIYEIKITDIIEEGTQVQKGDYVASLDHKIVEEELTRAREDLLQSVNDFEDAKMDSNLNLSNNRDQIINAREQVEAMQLILDESVYESPSVIRKAEMDMEKAKRTLDQEILAYKLRTQQAETRVNRRVVWMTQQQTRVKELEVAYQSLNIYAPKPGMVIYAKDRFGDKIKPGSTVSRWMPVIATLPDMSKMISVTYVNEIDISKIKTGQKVKMGIDAFPGKTLSGEIISVANIGQPLPKSDAKVFEVKIRIYGSDAFLRPAMTTSNVIQTGMFRDEVFLPSDAIFEDDSLRFVYLTGSSPIKQIIEPGDENENFTIIRQGLQPGDKVLLNPPANEKEVPIQGMEIFREIVRKKAEQARQDSFSLEQTLKTDAEALLKDNPIQSGAER